MRTVLESLWFFLPILAANQGPGIANNLNLPGARIPISSHWLGANKTWAAYYAGPVAATVAIYIQQLLSGWTTDINLFDYQRPDLWLVAILFGLGAALGDHGKSFVKRRLGITPGAKWWPWDQTDFLIGGILLSLPLVGWIGFWRVLIMFTAMACIIHPVGNWIGYKQGWRRTPW